MTGERPDWLIVERRDAPLIVSIPHAGTDLLDIRAGFRRVRGSRARTRTGGLTSSTISSRRSARRWCARGFRARSSTSIAIRAAPRSIPVRRRPNSCPTTTFDGEPLYRAGRAPDAAEIAERRRLYFDPYHAALGGEIARLRQKHQRVALFDAHSIRSLIPRLFDGELPVFNLGHEFRRELRARDCARRSAPCSPRAGKASVVDGRFKGGWITRAYGRPREGVEAVQLELACRAYMHEPERPAPENWPTPIDEKRAAPTRATLKRVLEAILECAAHDADVLISDRHCEPWASKDARPSGRTMARQSRDRQAPFDLWIASSTALLAMTIGHVA